MCRQLPSLERSTALTLFLLFAGALALRAWALNWGLPYVEHLDEPALLETSIQMVRNGDANPHRFLYPSLFLYLIAGAIRLYAWWGMQQGLYTSLQELPVQHYQFTVAPQLFVWARGVTAILGAVTVPALYLLARGMFDVRTALLAAVTLMLAPFHVAHSHYITTDAPTGLWVVLALLGAWGVAVGGAWRTYLLGGLMVGLAAGTKYNAGIVAIALPIAHLLHWRGRAIAGTVGRLVASGAVAILSFLATTPYAILDWQTFLADLRFNSVHYAEGLHGDFIGQWQIGEYAIFLWREGLFPATSIAALVAIPVVLRRHPRQSALLLSVLGAGLLLLVSYEVNFVRNLLPIFPLMLLLAAAGVVTLADYVQPSRGQQATLALVAALLLIMPLRDTWWQLNYWARPHTMKLAADAVRELPQGMRIAVELNAVEWSGNPIVFPVRQLIEQPVSWYRANGFRYVVVNDDFASPQDRTSYEEFRAQATTLAEYPRRRQGIQPGPGGALLDLGEHVDEMVFVRHAMQFGDEIALLGYELRPGEPRAQITPLEGADVREIPQGQPLQINLYWRAQDKPSVDYTLFIHVLDQQGQRVTQRDLPVRYGDYQTSHWQRNELVIDRADLALPVLPLGDYQLVIGLYDAERAEALLPAEPDTTLVTITVK